MNTLFSLLKNRINFWLMLPGSILLIILSGTIAVDIYQFLPKQIQEILIILSKPKAMITLLLLFLAILACYLALFLSYYKKPNIKDYEHVITPGFYKHKKNGEYYCKKCLIKDKIASPLNPIAVDEFCCRICDQKYKIDYNVMINDSYLSIALDNDPLWKRHDKAVKELILKDKS